LTVPLVLLLGFTDQFADVLEKNCIKSIPDQQVMFLFPQIGGDIGEVTERSGASSKTPG